MTLLQSAFINVINLSIAASFLMLAVILLRPFLKRVPKWLVCALWALVAVRLVVPFSLESRWSLVPAWKVSVSHAEETQEGCNGNQSGISAMDDRQGETVTKNMSEDHDAEHAPVISTEKELENFSEKNAWQGNIRENDGETVAHAEEINAESVASKQNDQDGIAINETKEHPSENISENETATEMTDQQSDGRREESNAKTGKDENVIATEKSNVTTDESVASTGESMLRRTFTGVLMNVGSGIWLAGIIAMLAYIVISFVRLRIRLRTAVRLETGTDVKVWMSDAITEPFVLGIIRPNIYVPSAIEEGDLECVLRHEQAHVRRGDYLWKPLGFLVLCVYWFHPLCWISYLLFCRDVEMACDEKATKEYDMAGRKRYCQALLNLSQGKKNSLIGTVAFGENGTKSRVKAVLDYKKPSFWVVLAGVFACLALGVFFMTSPNGQAAGNLLSFPAKIQRTDIVYDEEGNAKEISFDLSMQKGKDGVKLFGNILFDGRSYLDASETIKNAEGDFSNLFVPKNSALDLWTDYIAIDPLGEGLDSYILLVMMEGETKRYFSEKPKVSSDHPKGKQQDLGVSTGEMSEETVEILSGKAAWETEGISISDFYARDDGDIQNAYVIDENGILWGYGENRYGQLGQGFTDQKFYKERVKVAENVIHVDDSETGFAIYLTEDHKLYGLGNDGSGVLLTNGNADWNSYVKGEEHAVCSPVLLMEQVQYACCGRNDVVCLLEDGSVWIWGITGISTAREYYYMPEPVKILDGAILVTGGLFNHAALLSDGSVWTWGYNYAGGCGVAEFGIVDTPTKVAEDVIKVWTSKKRTNTCADYENMSPINEKQMESTIIEKADHTFLSCGEGVGNEKRILKKYYEAVDFSVICTHEFLPCMPLNPDGTEVTARQAFSRFLTGDRTLLDPEQERLGYFAGFLTGLDFGFEYEYVLMDLDEDGTEELIVQGGDDLGDYNGVFHWENGRIVSWRDDAFESDRVYLLLDGSLAKRWCEYSTGRQFWTVFRYLSNGEEEEIKRLVCGDPSAAQMEAGIDGHDAPWCEIDGVEVTEEELQREYERFIYNKRVTSWRSATTGEIRQSGEGTGIPIWCYDTVHFEYKWLTKLEDFDQNGEEEYLTVETPPDFSGCKLTVYWNKKAVYQYMDALNIIRIRNYQYVDLDEDGERELFLELLPNVNNMGLVQYLVLKEGEDGWKSLENYETAGESVTNSFPLKITYSDKPWEAKITCEGYEGEILVDVKRVYDALEKELRDLYGDRYQKAFEKGNSGEECAQTAAWGIWEIGFRRFEGELCLVARHGIVRESKDDLWGVVDVIFHYDKTGKICVRDMRFEYAEEYFEAQALPFDTVMSDVKLFQGAYVDENLTAALDGETTALKSKEYCYLQIDQPSAYSFKFQVRVYDPLTNRDLEVTDWQTAYFIHDGFMAFSRFDEHELYFAFAPDQTDPVTGRMNVNGLADFFVFSSMFTHGPNSLY